MKQYERTIQTEVQSEDRTPGLLNFQKNSSINHNFKIHQWKQKNITLNSSSEHVKATAQCEPSRPHIYLAYSASPMPSSSNLSRICFLYQHMVGTQQLGATMNTFLVDPWGIESTFKEDQDGGLPEPGCLHANPASAIDRTIDQTCDLECVYLTSECQFTFI